MASPHTYKVDLSLQADSRSQATLKELRESFKNSDKDLNQLSADFQRFQDAGIDASHEYHKILNDEIKDYDKKLRLIEEEQIKLIANKNISEDSRKAQLKDLDDKKKRIKAHQRELELRIKMQKITGKTLSEDSKLLQVGTKMLAMQEKMNKLLGKESKIRAAMSKLGGVAKVGGAVVAASAGALIGLGKAAVDSAGATVNKADALKSLRSDISPKVVDNLYIKTGADFGTIIQAINRVASVAGKDNVEKFAEVEIKNPGHGLLLAAQKAPNLDINYGAVYDQIRKQTGIADTSELSSAALASRAVKTGMVGENDFMLAYAKLTQAGLDGESASRIISKIANGRGAKSFIEAFNEADLGSMVYDKAIKNTLKNQNLKLSDLTNVELEESPEAKAARKTQETLREFELKKQEFLAKILPQIEPMLKPMFQLITSIMPPVLELIELIMPKILKAIGWIVEKVGYIGENNYTMIKVGEEMQKAADDLERDNQKRRWDEMHQREFEDKIARAQENQRKLYEEIVAREREQKGLPPLPQNAQGGLVTSPSICGEAGPELVLPLNNPSRAANIINNYTNSNTFNMSGNQTALSLSQAISNRRFIKHATEF